MEIVRAVNITADIYGILISLILMSYLILSGKKRLNRYFLLMCVFESAMLLGDISNWTCEGPGFLWKSFLLRAGILVFYCSSAFLLLAYTKYIMEYLSVRVRVHPYFWKVSVLLCAGYVCLCVLSLHNGLFFSFTSHNTYKRGDFFWLSQAVPFVMYGIDTAIVVRCRRFMVRKDKVFFMSYVLLPLVTEMIQIRFYGIALLSWGVSLSLLLIFIHIQLEREIVLKKQEKELAESRIDMMMTQIQPHFLYNSLVVIRQLCDMNPSAAKEAVTEFSYFLRGNMSALTCKGLVSFEQELSHVQNYLGLEKKRFGERLRVVYEIDVTDFAIPPISVQPLVENAVRHGILKKSGGGTVMIRTEERGDSYRVTVRDDGVGMEEKTDSILRRDGESVGIKNVRYRIASLCSGSVELYSRPGEGSLAVISIPKRERKDEYVSGR